MLRRRQSAPFLKEVGTASIPNSNKLLRFSTLAFFVYLLWQANNHSFTVGSYGGKALSPITHGFLSGVGCAAPLSGSENQTGRSRWFNIGL